MQHSGDCINACIWHSTYQTSATTGPYLQIGCHQPSPPIYCFINVLLQVLVSKHQGEVPQTFEELEQLAGVGHKTASVVMAVAFK